MKKIMFNDRYGLTKAVLEGRKTMTRRIVPECRELDVLRRWEHNEGAIATGYEEHTNSFRFDYCPDKKRRTSIDHLNLIPSYKVGEVVAVAQAYKHVFDEMMHGDYGDDRYDAFKNHYFGSGEGWHNKMFVKAEYMPHQIRITNFRIERLQDISEEDCVKEGIWEAQQVNYTSIDGIPYSPREAFAGLIDKVSGKGTWGSNPWVFVYEFELVK